MSGDYSYLDSFPRRAEKKMSAVSEPQRRKSANGRMQSSASSVVAADCRERGRGEAAGSSPEGGCGAKKGRSRRVKSARETRLEQESSEIFPPAEPGKGAWGRTQYDDNFGRKQPVTPVPVRPVSPTRRNNPHPAKPFLQWKHPVRIHPHKKSVSPTEDTWKYISESFYDDYTDTRNTGDAKNEVPVTNLATIEFPGNKKNGILSGQQLVSGTRVQLKPRTCHTHGRAGSGEQSPAIRPPSPKSLMMHNTVRGSTLPVLREWLITASNKERELLLQMLTAAHTDSEDTRLQKAIEDVLRPDSAARVQQWLQTATSSERKTLLGVMETLAVASGQLSGPALVALPPAAWPLHPSAGNHHRSYSYPVSLRPRVSHHHKSHAHISSHYSRHSNHHHHHHHHKPHCHKYHKNSGASTGGDMALVGKRVGVKRDKTPELWHHKIPGPVTDELRVIHPASVFQLPHRDRGRHFAIHPEWPTA